MSKYKKLSYRECVNKAKKLLKDYKEIRYEVCELALRACEIKLGGHRHNNYYSVSMFSYDVGINPSTLRGWLDEHRAVFSKIDVSKEKVNYKIARIIYKEVGSSADSKTIKKLYNKYQNYTKEDWSLVNNIKFAKTIKNFVLDYNLNKFNTEDVKELTQLIEISLQEIKNQLKGKKTA